MRIHEEVGAPPQGGAITWFDSSVSPQLPPSAQRGKIPSSGASGRAEDETGAARGPRGGAPALLIVPLSDASGWESTQASASGVSAKKFKKLKRKVNQLQQQVDELAGQPGPQGPQGEQGPRGPAGTAPACQGNNAADKMVKAGSVCIDKYEVSVWSSPTGGTQYGVSSDNYPCNDSGQGCDVGTAGAIYARSVPGVTPSRFITYFRPSRRSPTPASAFLPTPSGSRLSPGLPRTRPPVQRPVESRSRPAR